MKFEINAALFNATLAAQAVKSVRHHLNGFFLCAEHGELVATNGSIMCIAPLVPPPDQPSWEQYNVPKNGAAGHGWIFGGITKPLPKSAEHVIIDTEIPRIFVLGTRYKGPRYVALKEIAGTYPNYRRVKAENDASGKVDAVRCLNAEYLYRCFRWAGIKSGAEAARFIFPKSAADSIEVHPVGSGCAEINQLHITLMPVHIWRQYNEPEKRRSA